MVFFFFLFFWVGFYCQPWLQDPPRGESEGHQHLKAQTYGVSIGTILADRHSWMCFACLWIWPPSWKHVFPIITPRELMELAAFLPNRQGAAIDLSPSKGSDIRYGVSISTCGCAFIHVLWSLNLAAILKTCVSISAPLHSSWWNWQHFYRIGEMLLLIHQYLKTQTYGVSIGQELILIPYIHTWYMADESPWLR